jgi:ribosomal protein S18 acetylase RimI-like enzyme
MGHDRVWCAYALADLDPTERERSEWLVSQDGVVLIYKGFDPPILFAHGDPEALTSLLDQVPPGVYQYTLRKSARTILGGRLQPKFELDMWRMVLDPEKYPGSMNHGATRLTANDLPAIMDLFATSPDPPDAFHERQLAAGPFFGVYEGDDLICMAGIHVISIQASVAAVGNVLTRPNQRGRGMATRASSAVVSELLNRGIQTIVLNVATANHPAIHCYQRLGFQPIYNYYEGIGKLAPTQI